MGGNKLRRKKVDKSSMNQASHSFQLYGKRFRNQLKWFRLIEK